ncbi:MAG TPA: protein CbbY [Hydrogenophaga sp.]|jgi:HAD superfamily hydrolase (TIGR01509 family)|uniref:HAD-IA family hydrolase n=1 Tax=Hydrogenophaga sp. TaxID=1904254 RepID=UPI0008B3002D|nr:HAD-IA family hydrolase [Hydrogenophaga sp.]MBU4184232.1 HAD-IA family hydrolase [Gammaproteobacteria bacterium]OGA73686.1 MAG: protein CbbY [Burkholderiales bacterium GWE1_65_30]OGA93021.1 MAG: protein CbbY [Burkholderiales bacterium GWF1_66_17]OGB18410.1 MAG: protein CbbY [Burkholderiales bacterium RIFCSPHIGHO2_02_FULL_66_10]OGB36209.1 MAG: protein CbbY [Burkholderiales bacterium RIFCSPLOWO2_02_FULL_66_35]PKO78878.1 MAG: protein CbbY [Betaproteobacteria bacterium HGW-Betaproteobacteria-1
MLNALIFDVDGTLADTESVHLEAFNHAFRQEGLDWHWSTEQYTQLLDISGGKERMLHHWRTVDPDMKEVDAGALTDTINRLHEIKTAYYENAVNSGAVTLRPGVLALMNEARGQGLQLAIATTTSPVNIAALMRSAIGLDWRSHFLAVGDASNAPIKKPHPQVYLKVLADMGMSALECVAFEDSSNGLRAATAAGLDTVITPNSFTAHHDFKGALRVVPDLSQVNVARLREWHNR